MLGNLEQQPADALLALIKLHNTDPRADKIDLGVGVYKTDQGDTPVFGAIKAGFFPPQDTGLIWARSSAGSTLSFADMQQRQQRVTELLLADPAVEFVGARLGSGCTSGHGVCGLARLSPRSLAATGIFMATGAATVFVMRHVLGG